MKNIITLFKSRTAWTILVLFLFNGISGIKDIVPPEYQSYVNGALSLIAFYFRANPQAKFTPSL